MPRGSAMGHRAPVLWLTLPFAVGISLAHASPWELPTALLIGGVGLTGAAVWLAGRAGSAPQTTLATVVLLVVLLGALHHQTHRARLPDWDQLPQREATLAVRVDRPFPDGNPSRPIAFIGTITGTTPLLHDLMGQTLQVEAWRLVDGRSAQRGEVLEIRGELEPLPRRAPASAGDDFEAYLIDAGVNFRLVRGRVATRLQEPSAYARWREAVKARAAGTLRAGLEHRPALGGALQAMMLGDRTELPRSTRDLFVRSGTMHLFAISGLHIGIIAGVLYGGLRIARLSPTTAWLLGALLLAFYVDLIGRTPSAVRAWIMVTCVQASVVLRAPGNPLAGLATSALLVLLWNPLQLFSAGFQMSYGVVAALLLYGLPLGEQLTRKWRPWQQIPVASLSRWQRLWQDRWGRLVEAAALTWSATIVGLISSVAFFGWFTPLALPANLVLIPLAAFVITGGLLAMVTGLAGATTLALVFNHGAAMVLLGMQTILAWSSAQVGPGLSAHFGTTWWGEAGIGLVLTAMTIGYARGWQGRWAQWWYPPALTALVLVTGMRFA